MKRLISILLLVAWSSALVAQGASGDDVLPPPDLPHPVQSGESIAPEVNIRKEEDRTVEEYSVNGRLYMVKITPIAGKPYYLVDNDGDGHMETELESPHGEDIAIPQWVIFSW